MSTGDTWDMYCSFCGGPLEDTGVQCVRHIWGPNKSIKWPLKDGEWYNPPGYPIPDKPIREIMRTSDSDDGFWSEYVCVGPIFKPSWVSRPCTASNKGQLDIEDSSDWQDDTDEEYNVIHIGCLSLLCRRLDVTPEEWWASFYGPESKYSHKYSEGRRKNMLMRGIDYYDINTRNGRFFGYAIEYQDENGVKWFDPKSYEECNWLLAAPTLFPTVSSLPPPLKETDIPGLSQGPNQISTQKVIFTPELLYAILDYVVPYINQENMAEELMKDETVNDSPTLILALETLRSMLLVNKRIHNQIVQGRQDLYFRLVWQFGWMLPACPADWKSWNSNNDPLPLPTGIPIDAIPGEYNQNRPNPLSNSKDWRAYLIMFLRKEEPHIRNRYRFHRMLMQHARGKMEILPTKDKLEWWKCGNFVVGTGLECVESYEWEEAEWLEEDESEDH